MSIPDKLVVCARQIAIYQAYDNIENGLQPLNDYKVDGVLQPGLNSKFEHEQLEFAEAVASGDIWHMYHEAADLLYYAACIGAQEQHASDTLSHYNRRVLAFRRYLLAYHEIIRPATGFDLTDVENAALAKYDWRAEQSGNKDEAYEIELIKKSTQYSTCQD